MVRKTMIGMQKFATNLQDVIQSTEDAGNHVADFYEKLEEAMNENQLAAMSKTEFQEIVAEFNDATETYESNVTKLQEVAAPAKLMGLYANFKKHYADYALACRAMVNSIDVANQAIDQQSFNDAGDEQEKQMDKISLSMQKMMAKL